MRIGILVFDKVEELDFAAPLEVFGTASRIVRGIEVVTMSKDGQLIRGRNGLRVQPDHSFSNCPPLDLLIIPGGTGASEHVRYDEETISFVRAHASRGQLASVCTGALVLAAAGVLKGRRATTHWSDLELLRQYPEVQVLENVRFVQEDRVATSAGVSAGIDLSLAIVRDLFGDKIAKEVAHDIDYLYVAL